MSRRGFPASPITGKTHRRDKDKCTLPYAARKWFFCFFPASPERRKDMRCRASRHAPHIIRCICILHHSTRDSFRSSAGGQPGTWRSTHGAGSVRSLETGEGLSLMPLRPGKTSMGVGSVNSRTQPDGILILSQFSNKSRSRFRLAEKVPTSPSGSCLSSPLCTGTPALD